MGVDDQGMSTSTNGNGAHVTWRELNLALDPIRRDVKVIRDDVKALVESRWLGPRAHAVLQQALAALAVAIVTAAATLLLR